MSIEENFNIGFIAALALREKQIQQNYRPLIAVHKWFARRPGTLFRGLILSEFSNETVENNFYASNSFSGKIVADPFMGGGTPLLEANRLGCDIIGADINPMAKWIVNEEIAAIDLTEYSTVAQQFLTSLSEEIGHLYRTRCPKTGRSDGLVKYFLWVKVGQCENCANHFDLFPTYMISENVRHPYFVLVCPECGDLNEVSDLKELGRCKCSKMLKREGPVKRSKCICPHCEHENTAPFRSNGPPQHRLFAIEYFLDGVKEHTGRLFKKPDAEDLKLFGKATSTYQNNSKSFIPEELISKGDESSRLHRWGYAAYRDLFNARQLLGLQKSAEKIALLGNPRVAAALATNFSDLLRYQNMLCRYDTMALKSLDIFSIHGFPVGYIQVESNILGIVGRGGQPVGSGGWLNIISKYTKAKHYCESPFEVAFEGKRKVHVPTSQEWIGPVNRKRPSEPPRMVDLRCLDATKIEIAPKTLDGVFTDPPYFGMVQYGELMEFCFVWLKKLMERSPYCLEASTSIHQDELTGNHSAERDIYHFSAGLSDVFREMALALKSGAPLVFTYHHNQQDAYVAIGIAILNAGLNCSASLPCPAEMSGSIHIHGTSSSIIDTVFVCREHGKAPKKLLFSDVDGLMSIIATELADLSAAGLKASNGDIRCIALGHITRMAIWNLRRAWKLESSTITKFTEFKAMMNSIAMVDEVTKRLSSLPLKPSGLIFDYMEKGNRSDAVAF